MPALLLALLLAVPPEHLGTIVFPNSGKPEAQSAFLRGVLLLHNFAYPQAKAAFVEAQQIDPKFALAYWGEAMTYNHPLWNQVDVDAGRQALKNVRQLAATPRERGYIDAVEALYGPGDKPARNYAYEAAMERVARANPGDVEAQVFWALSILGSREWHQLDERRSVRAAAILEELFPTHQDHPGVLHYLIHAYDDPVHAPLGLRAARRYANVASSAPHALHMPSHIFLQLGMWDETVRSNEAAYALSKEWKEPDMHSLHWLQYAYLQQLRYADAKRLIDEAGEHHNEDMKVRYAVESGDWDAFVFHQPLGKALQAIAHKRFDEAAGFIKEMKDEGPEPDEVRAMLAGARGNWNDAFRYAQLAIAAEEKLGVPSGPPDNFKPAHELYGELLMQAGKTKEAVAEFETSLLRTPNRAASVADLQRATDHLKPVATSGR
jgi:tetratricopeptide (TPR) repeat protein